MLDSDWLMNILRRAIIFQEKHSYEVVSGLLTALQFLITVPNYFSYFKDAYSPQEQKNQNPT